MSRIIEPKGWADMSQEKRVSLVNSLADAGLLNIDSATRSNDLLDQMSRESESSLAYLHAIKVLEHRGVEAVARDVEQRSQADMVVRVFGEGAIKSLPVAFTKPEKPRHAIDESGLSM